MELFSTLTDSDIFENPAPKPDEYTSRPTVKAIVIDNDKNIALLSVLNHRALFPGGGVEAGEALEEALLRECKEEIGCDVEILQELGLGIQYRAKSAQKYKVYFYIAKVIGEKGSPTSTQKDEQGATILWLTPEEVLSRLESQLQDIAEDEYAPHFNCRTHLEAFRNTYRKINTIFTS